MVPWNFQGQHSRRLENFHSIFTRSTTSVTSLPDKFIWLILSSFSFWMVSSFPIKPLKGQDLVLSPNISSKQDCCWFKRTFHPSWGSSWCQCLFFWQHSTQTCCVVPPVPVIRGKNKAEWLWTSNDGCGDSKDGEKIAELKVTPSKTSTQRE